MTNYRPLDPIAIADLFDGRLTRFNVYEHTLTDESDSGIRCLTDGRNYLRIYPDEQGSFTATRFGANNPLRITRAIEAVFNTHLASEHEPQYWGFETQEEWDAWEHALIKKGRDEFYEDLKKYIAGQPNEISPGTVGEAQGEIAKKLVEQRPELALPDAKEELMNLIDAIYDRDHAMTVTLDEKDLAAIKMIYGDPEDLSQC